MLRVKRSSTAVALSLVSYIYILKYHFGNDVFLYRVPASNLQVLWGYRILYTHSVYLRIELDIQRWTPLIVLRARNVDRYIYFFLQMITFFFFIYTFTTQRRQRRCVQKNTFIGVLRYKYNFFPVPLFLFVVARAPRAYHTGIVR